MPTPADQSDPDTITSELADPDDYHQMRRLRAIHDARSDVRNALTNIEAYTKMDKHENQIGELANALCTYIAELEPLAQQLDHNPTAFHDLPDHLPWATAPAYADYAGRHPADNNYATTQESLATFRACNEFLDNIKPLIEDTEDTEWEV